MQKNEGQMAHGSQQASPGQGQGTKDNCGPACGSIASERNRYFTGKYMTARDFRDEQEYFVSRHRLHNRLLHGWGIVCGLQVIPHDNEDCKANWVRVTPGIAVDCCGRELIVEETTALKVWDPPGGQSKANPDTGPFIIYVAYEEDEVEQTPALYAEGMCDPHHLEASRVREVARLHAARLMDVDPGCWPQSEEGAQPIGYEKGAKGAEQGAEQYGEQRGPGEATPEGEGTGEAAKASVGPSAHRRICRDDCTDKGVAPAEGCLTPVCPCKEGVPLAVVQPVGGPRHYRIDRDEIDVRGRRDLQTPKEYLTHIVHYNWPHGGEVNLSYLRERMGGRLEIYFDRKLAATHPEAPRTGINQFTFCVEYHATEGREYPLNVLYNPEDPPRLENEHCRAVFPIPSELLNTDTNIGDTVIRVTLRCDFIPDCHERPVDGTHFPWKAETGNGIPGGDFVSWFRVIDDEEEERRRRRRGAYGGKRVEQAGSSAS